jgi:molecular chaperone GrpE
MGEARDTAPHDTAPHDTAPAEEAAELDDFTGQFVRPEEEDLEEIGEVVEHDLEQLLSERDSFKDIAQRLQADFDNYRKRAAAQSADEVDRATGRLAEAFLPVLDAAEAAYLQHPDEVGPLLNVMLGELRKHGLETLDLDGQPFDPEVAEAVAHEPGDCEGPVVVAEVLRSGYRWRGRTLRPAMVRTRG